MLGSFADAEDGHRRVHWGTRLLAHLAVQDRHEPVP